MSNINMQDKEMSNATPVDQSNANSEAGQGAQYLNRFRARNLTGLVTPTPTQPEFPVWPATTPAGNNSFTGMSFALRPAPNNTNRTNALAPVAGPSTAAASIAPPTTVNPSKGVPPRQRKSASEPWHTWGQLLNVMGQNLEDHSAGLKQIHKLAERSMTYRQKSFGKRAVQQEEGTKGHQLSPADRAAVKKAAIAKDPSYNQLFKVMGKKGSKHTDEQLVRLSKGQMLTYRCCRCRKASKKRQAGKEAAETGMKCGCGHQLCLICLHVQRTGDELIEFGFMGLGDKGKDGDQSKDGGSGGGMGGASMAMEVEA